MKGLQGLTGFGFRVKMLSLGFRADRVYRVYRAQGLGLRF